MTTISAQQTLNQLNNNTALTNYQKGQANVGTGEISKDGFMQLLLAQLKYQDPIEPVDNTQQLTQQAQFTQVEELQKLNETLGRSSSLTQAATLVGQDIEYLDEAGNSYSGTVDSVVVGDTIGLQVGSQLISMDQVSRINAS